MTAFIVTCKYNKFSSKGKFICVHDCTPNTYETAEEANKRVEWIRYLNTNRTEQGKYFDIRVNGALA